MRNYLLRRLLALVPTLFFGSVIVFVTVRLIPGDVIDLMLSQNDVAADKMSRDQVVAALGLDKPMWQQYLVWVSGIVVVPPSSGRVSGRSVPRGDARDVQRNLQPVRAPRFRA